MSDNLAKEQNNEIVKYLNYYTKLDNPQYAVLINGKWGAGKTYFIRKYIKSISEEEAEDNENVYLKPIYVSLNGISSKKDVANKIKEELNPFMHSKGMKFAKNVLFGVLQTATHFNFDIDKDGEPDGKFTMDVDPMKLLKSDSPKIKGNRVLIFDDLERCKIELTEIFGFINDFVEHNRCKVVLIGDEEKITAKYDSDGSSTEISYKEFKEKLIGQTFALTADIHSAVEHFVSDNFDSKKLFNENKELIIEILRASKIENLRILKQALLDFDRFIKQFREDLTKHEKYNEYLKNLLPHFLIVYLEYKSGNHALNDIIHFGFNEEQKEANRNLKVKYDTILNRNKIGHRITVISYDKVIDYLNMGYSNPISLNQSILNIDFFKWREKEDWEILWGWEEMEDDKFKTIYDKVLKDFNDSKIENLFQVIHVAMIIIHLRNNKIITCNKAEIVKKAKSNIEEILTKTDDIAIPLPTDHAWNKGFRARETKEFNQIRNHARKLIVYHNLKSKDDFLKNLFENLNDENLLQIESELDKSLPDRSSSYSMNPILLNVEGSVLADKLLALNALNFGEFHSFMRRRYFPEEIYANVYLSPDNVVELPTIEKLREQVNARIDEFGKIKKYNLLNFIKFLDLLIEKLKKLKKANK